LTESQHRPKVPGRVLHPFLWSPLGAAAVLSLWAIWTHSLLTGSTGLQDALTVVIIFTFLSYVAALIVGLPIFLLLRRVHWMSQTACALGGAVGGLLFFLVPYSLWYGFWSTVAHRESEMIAPALGGLVTGLLFGHLHNKAV